MIFWLAAVGNAKDWKQVEKYLGNIAEGRTNDCKWVRLAAQRHFRDLELKKDLFYFDPEKGQRIIDFFPILRHTKGAKFFGKPFELELWQKTWLFLLFGWRRHEDDLRRFSTSTKYVPRKNGKTAEAAGVGNYLFVMDGEPGAEVYSLANSKDQASIVFNMAAAMVNRSPELAAIVEVYTEIMTIDASLSQFRPFASNWKKMDGYGASGVIADEVHAFDQRQLYDVVNSSRGSRDQSLMYSISTAGYDISTIGYELFELGCDILEETSEDDSFFPVIYSIDDKDDWENEEAWAKANPNLGISKSFSYMRDQHRLAKNSPGFQNEFWVKELNIWTTSAYSHIEPEAWKKCDKAYPLEFLMGRPCHVGIDLASVRDFTAMIFYFPEFEDRKAAALGKYYVPMKALDIKKNHIQDKIRTWARKKLVTVTAGKTTDYKEVFKHLKQAYKVFDIKNLGFDPHNAKEFISMVESLEVPCISVRQGTLSMSEPMKKLDRLYLEEKILFGKDPALRWMAGNVTAITDDNENIKPSKKKSKEKIDGFTALVNAIYAEQNPGEEPEENPYSNGNPLLVI
jgi:phage terminase large subunit-like protein